MTRADIVRAMDIMYRAGKDGLFFDGIVSGTREIKWTEGRNCKA